MSEALRELASRNGVLLEYVDIHGRLRLATDDGLRAALEAMHVLGPGEAPEAALSRSACREDRLPPVVVARTGVPLRILIDVPAAELASSWQWKVIEENGRTLQGRFDPAALTPAGGDAPRERRGSPVGLEIAQPFEAGYHRLQLLRDGEVAASAPLIVAPPSCYRPEALRRMRVWGLAVQLYAVRSDRNWGIGDFTDLARLVTRWAALGADIIGLNPLHALFCANPAHASPYSPSSRRWLNPLYLDVEAIEDYAASPGARERVRAAEFQLQLRRLRDVPLVDYPGVAAAKLEILSALFERFLEHELARDTSRARAFRAFQQAHGDDLTRYATFEALYERFRGEDPDLWSWRQWPEAFRDPASAEVAAFVRLNRTRVELFEYLQWQAALQVEAVAALAKREGMEVGLYFDLAVSIDGGGADAWSHQSLYATQTGIGAPPDDFSPQGQDWGLPPLLPQALRADGYAHLASALRANMRHAGALRIDHVMGLLRLFWIRHGRRAADGVYVQYPMEDLLAIVALESARNRCLVIGEDLGTVPDAVRAAMHGEGMLSYHPLYFEKSAHGEYKPPRDYPADALVAVATHDLPTLAGFWSGSDLTLRHALGLFDSEAAREAQVIGRAQDRARLLVALEREGLLPAGVTIEPVSAPQMTDALARALHAFLGRAPAAVLVVQPEDLLAMQDQVNLPGSLEDQHPNWRRKYSRPLEQWADSESSRSLADALCAARGVAPRAVRRRARRAAWRIPRCTYRLQMNGDFTFRDATAIVPYLARLGVSHVYCSPYLNARRGSQHGYDIIDHAAFNPDIGTRQEFDEFVRTLHAHGMGQVADVVPNHMGVMGADNAWWLDVLENGPAARHAEFFDIDWAPLNDELRGKLLVPVLGDHYGAALENAELKLGFDPERGEFSVTYYDHRFPVDPREYPTVLELRREDLASRLGGNPAALDDYQNLISAFRHLPPRSRTDPQTRAERARDKEVRKRQLAELCRREPEVGAAIEERVAEVNGRPGEPASFDALDALIKAQAWRPAYWRVASDEINYRRFFDINDLAALRMENPQVFEATHRLLLELVADGSIDCLRIDHPDGLYDPEQYFERLQHPFRALPSGGHEGPAEDGRRPVYVAIEKITASYERLAEHWAVHGTTGYRFANVVNGLFIDASAESRVDRIYRSFVGEEVDFAELLYRCKRLIVRTALSSELNVLASRLSRIAQSDRRTCDFTLNALRDALTEVVACFPVYRTYVTEAAGASAEDCRFIDWAVAGARRRSRAADVSIFDFVRAVLAARAAEHGPEERRREVIAFAMKFQQLSCPVMAKGLEDTAFYIYNRLVSLNDVGGDPATFGMSLAAFHGASADRARRWPHTMLATSTHDSKRSADARARIDVLSEMPAAWRLRLRRWSRLNRHRKRDVAGSLAPSRNDEYLLYQMLVASWPGPGADLEAYRERIQGAMLKAVREAKVHSSWINPDPEYESAMSGFIAALLSPSPRNRFVGEFATSAGELARFGMINSLAMTLIKLTSPGVPDIYRGDELWDFSLVDPDNRRPVDFARRAELLEQLARADREQPLATARQIARALEEGDAEGISKLFVTWRLLGFRRDHDALFRDGSYLPINATGDLADHVCAYARRHEGSVIVAVAPRLCAKLMRGEPGLPLGERSWAATALDLAPLGAIGGLANVLTGESLALRQEGDRSLLPVAEVLGTLPVALLHFEGPPPPSGAT